MANPGLLNLTQMIRSASLDRLEVISSKKSLRIETPIEAALVQGHWMAMALVAGPQLRITFKVHFMSDSGARLAHKALNMSVEQVTFEKTSDFMKEFCNLTLGLVKQVLGAKSIRSVVSLPLITRGFDEVFFPKSSGVLLTQDFWRIHFENGFVVCSAHIELLEPDLDLTQIPTKIEKQDDVGDVEFL